MPVLAALLPAACRSYVSWKHASLLHLDYGAALFGLLYLAVVLRRLLQEPSALFYFCIILVKVLPHAPLVLGFRRQFLRCVVLQRWMQHLCAVLRGWEKRLLGLCLCLLTSSSHACSCG